jgi:hypothetical protein
MRTTWLYTDVVRLPRSHATHAGSPRVVADVHDKRDGTVEVWVD